MIAIANVYRNTAIQDRNVDIDDRYMNIGDRNIDIDDRNVDIDDRYMNISDRDASMRLYNHEFCPLWRSIANDNDNNDDTTDYFTPRAFTLPLAHARGVIGLSDSMWPA